MHRVAELFGSSTSLPADWAALTERQICPFTARRCLKVRKSDPSISIGTCTVRAGRDLKPLVICPNRLLAGGAVFADALRLLTAHEPANELHVLSEVPLPGGSVDYFIVSVRNGRLVDFVGIELQTLDTTGTVWPHRQSFLADKGVVSDHDRSDERSFGVNWKMTAKTILVQLHHKIETFEAVDRKLVLVLQDELMSYMAREFSFGHLGSGSPSDSMHFHSYTLHETESGLQLSLQARHSTDMAGIATALGLGRSGEMEIAEIFDRLRSKLSPDTRWQPAAAMQPEPLPEVSE